MTMTKTHDTQPKGWFERYFQMFVVMPRLYYEYHRQQKSGTLPVGQPVQRHV